MHTLHTGENVSWLRRTSSILLFLVKSTIIYIVSLPRGKIILYGHPVYCGSVEAHLLFFERPLGFILIQQSY